MRTKIRLKKNRSKFKTTIIESETNINVFKDDFDLHRKRNRYNKRRGD